MSDSPHMPRRRTVLAGILALSAAGVIGAQTLGPEDPAPAPTPTPVPELVIGMANGSNTDPKRIEARAGMPMDTSKTYYDAPQVGTALTRVGENIAAGRAVSELSFKPPLSWASMASGSGDDWARDLSGKLRASVAGTGHRVRIAVQHEPENDTGSNAGDTTAGRDAWKDMQSRLAPLFDVPGVDYIVILMGYHSLERDSDLYELWNLDEAIPDTPAIKGVGYDLYETRGVDGQGWRDFKGAYFPRIREWHAAHGNLPWGLSETGITVEAFAEDPAYFDTFVSLIFVNGGSWLTYFNSNLNSVAEWEMGPDGPRERGFIEALRAY